MERKESKLRWKEMKQSEDKRDSAIVLEKSVNLLLLKTPKIPRPPTYSIVSFIWGSHPESFWLLRILLSASCLSPEFYERPLLVFEKICVFVCVHACVWSVSVCVRACVPAARRRCIASLSKKTNTIYL